jgi:ATP-dependent helicase HrpA
MGRGERGLIGVTQPRRIAATSVAARVASEVESPLGGVVGYQVRFDDRTSRSTAIKFMTDGILLAEIHGDRLLRRYDTLIIDEAHERSLTIDFLLGWMRRILPERPDLKVLISSATIETERFAEFFGGAPVIQVEGRTFPVDVLYEPPHEDDDLPAAVASAVVSVTSLERWSFGFVPWSELRFARFDGGIELGDHRGREVERVALQARCATGTRLRSSTWPASRRGRRPLRGEDPSHVHR